MAGAEAVPAAVGDGEAVLRAGEGGGGGQEDRAGPAQVRGEAGGELRLDGTDVAEQDDFERARIRGEKGLRWGGRPRKAA